MLESLFVNSTYAKNGVYAETIKSIQGRKVCPFCPEVFPGQWHTNPILRRSGNWLITRNMFPYTNTQEHLLIVGNRHIEELAQLGKGDFADILKLAKWATMKLGLPGGLLAMRFGDSAYTGATVKHIHAHLVVPKQIEGSTQVVNFPIG